MLATVLGGLFIVLFAQAEYADVNGQRLYYEVHGQGKPLVVVHGSFQTVSEPTFRALFLGLTKNRQVIAPEMQGHGRTRDNGRPFSMGAFADDIAALLRSINASKADILGYSLGGSIALQTAVSYPTQIDKVVLISSVSKLRGWSPKVRNAVASIVPEFFHGTPVETEYKKVAPQPEEFDNFVRKLAAFDAQEFDIGDSKIRGLRKPFFIIKGDTDGVMLRHVAHLFDLVGGSVFSDLEGLSKSRLAVLPAQGHVSLLNQTGYLTREINKFLRQK